MKLRTIAALALFCAAVVTGGCEPETASPTTAPRHVPLQTNADGIGVTSNLAQTKVHNAHDRGLTGTGATVVIFDSGLTEQAHPALPRVDIYSLPISDGTRPYRQASEAEDNWHGTAVMGIIAARPVDAGLLNSESVNTQFQGVAPGATVQSIQLNFGSSDGPYDPISISDLPETESLLSAIADINTVSPGAFINLSLGIEGSIARAEYTEATLENQLGNELLDRLRQDGVNEEDKTVYVWAAGNSRGTEGTTALDVSSPEIMNGLPAKIPSLQGNWLTVVAVNPPEFTSIELDDEFVPHTDIPRDQPGGLAVFSNACGIAADFCLAAPGVCVPATAAPGVDADTNQKRFSPNPSPLCLAVHGSSPEGYRRVSGTSFAAPMVVGALALMHEQFRDPNTGEQLMTNAQLVARLLATADKTDYSDSDGPDYSDQSIYGQGLLDVDAATTPVGMASLQLPSGATQPISALSYTSTADSGAQLLYASLLAGLSSAEVMTLDTLQAPFWVRADALLQGLSIQATGSSVSTRQTPAYLLGNAYSAQSVFTAFGADTAALLNAGGRTDSASALPAAPWMNLLGSQSLTSGVHLALGRGELTALWGWGYTVPENRYRAHAQPQPSQMLAAQYRYAAGFADISLLSGTVEEDNGLLGLDGGVVRTGSLNTQTQFAAVQLDRALSHSWQLSAAWHWAKSQVRLPAGELLVGVSGLRGQYARLSLSHRGTLSASDRLTLNLVRDDSLAGGQAQWQLPASLSGGQVQYGRMVSSLALSARYGAELRYLNRTGRHSTLEFALRRNEQLSGKTYEYSTSLQWQLRF